jgi:hypothetical protein
MVTSFISLVGVTRVNLMRFTTHGSNDQTIPRLLNAISEIAADDLDEEVGIAYYCPGQHRHSHHNIVVVCLISNIRNLLQLQAHVQGHYPLSRQNDKQSGHGSTNFRSETGQMAIMVG